jgi:hypothetical protein
MPFKSEKQRRFLHAKAPKVAEKWEEEAKAKGKPAVRPGAKKKAKKKK